MFQTDYQHVTQNGKACEKILLIGDILFVCPEHPSNSTGVPSCVGSSSSLEVTANIIFSANAFLCCKCYGDLICDIAVFIRTPSVKPFRISLLGPALRMDASLVIRALANLIMAFTSNVRENL